MRAGHTLFDSDSLLIVIFLSCVLWMGEPDLMDAILRLVR